MKILFLVNKKTYLTKLCRARFIGFDILEKNNKITMKYWGNGWDNYNNNLKVQENINNLNEKFDICIAFKPLELKNFKDINLIKVIQYNEMYDIKWTLKEIKESGSQLIICHHLNDFEKYKKMNIPNVKFVYVGHCAEKTIFKNYNIPKEYDILLAGALGSYHYPLRVKFFKILSHLEKKYRCHIHPHPGYDLLDAYTNKYQKEMAIAINKSKIVLTCSSKWKYRLGKYVEIPMCGSVICSDLPYDKFSDYNHVIEVTNSMTTQEIFNKISYYLDNEDKRLEKVNKGIEFAKEYTAEKYAERLLKEINEFLN
jgi:glycosyltransferase involved in cell wall biosynthesis